MLYGEVAMVTGASRGIGRAAALRLARAGADVLVHARSTEAVASLVDEVSALGRRALAASGDVADPATAEKAVALAQEAFGRVDILVNNAGINRRSGTLDMSLEDWQRVLDVNLNGTLHFCRAVLPGMIEKGGGRIVNMSSSASKMAHRNAAPAYGASKAAVNYLTMHLAFEMAQHGIRVNAVCPGAVETDMTAEWEPAYRESLLARVPMGRLGTVGEIADAVFFLASPLSGYTTGTTLDANGGTRMG